MKNFTTRSLILRFTRILSPLNLIFVRRSSSRWDKFHREHRLSWTKPLSKRVKKLSKWSKIRGHNLEKRQPKKVRSFSKLHKRRWVRYLLIVIAIQYPCLTLIRRIHKRTLNPSQHTILNLLMTKQISILTSWRKDAKKSKRSLALIMKSNRKMTSQVLKNNSRKLWSVLKKSCRIKRLI